MSIIDERQLVTWFASCITALTSASASGGGSTTITQLVISCASQVSADTGLSAQEKALITLISSAIQNTQPSSSIHSQV